jgi:hypothetical protein
MKWFSTIRRLVGARAPAKEHTSSDAPLLPFLLEEYVSSSTDRRWDALIGVGVAVGRSLYPTEIEETLQDASKTDSETVRNQLTQQIVHFSSLVSSHSDSRLQTRILISFGSALLTLKRHAEAEQLLRRARSCGDSSDILLTIVCRLIAIALRRQANVSQELDTLEELSLVVQRLPHPLQELQKILLADRFDELSETEAAAELLASIRITREIAPVLGMTLPEGTDSLSLGRLSEREAQALNRQRRRENAINKAPDQLLFRAPIPLFSMGQLDKKVVKIDAGPEGADRAMRLTTETGEQFDVPKRFLTLKSSLQRALLQAFDEVRFGALALSNAASLPTFDELKSSLCAMDPQLTAMLADHPKNPADIDRILVVKHLSSVRQRIAALQLDEQIFLSVMLLLTMGFISERHLTNAYLACSTAVERVIAAERTNQTVAPDLAYQLFATYSWILHVLRQTSECIQYAEKAMFYAKTLTDTRKAYLATLFYAAALNWKTPGDQRAQEFGQEAESLIGLPSMQEVAIPIASSSKAEWQRVDLLLDKVDQMPLLKPRPDRPFPNTSHLAREITRTQTVYTAWNQVKAASASKDGRAILQACALFRTALLDRCREEESVEGVSEVVAPYRYILDFEASVGLKFEEDETIWQALGSADLVRAISMREIDLRQTGVRRKVDEWTPSPPNWRAIEFPETNSERIPARTFNLRGNFTAPCPSLSLLPIKLSDNREQFFSTVDRNSVTEILKFETASSERTILLYCFALNEDISIVPFALDANEIAKPLLTTENKVFTISKAKIALDDLSSRLQQDVLDIRMYLSTHVTSAPQQWNEIQEFDSLSATLQHASKILNVEALISLLTRHVGDLTRVHCIVVPDGVLYRLPFHVLSGNSGALVQQFASIRYSTSLRALRSQQQLQTTQRESRGTSVLRGVMFASANLNNRAGLSTLSAVADEASAVVRNNNEKWWIHGSSGRNYYRSSKTNFKRRYQTGNVLWFMGHGGPLDVSVITDYEDEWILREPCLLFDDEPLGVTEILTDFDFSENELIHLSACMLGKIDSPGNSRELIGPIPALEGARARRVVSPMWPVWDPAAAEFGRHWSLTLEQGPFGDTPRTPHSFAMAFKKAVEGFCHDRSHGFDHEFFWAPYTFYGLG